MNRAFLIVGIPAVVTSFCWLAFGWGWRRAVIVTGAELVVILTGVIYILRRENARVRNSAAAAAQSHGLPAGAGEPSSPEAGG